MTFTEHLAELRKRLLVSVVAVVVIAGAAFPAMPLLLRFVESVFLPGVQLHVFAPAEVIQVQFKLSFFVGLIVAFPVILYETYAFVAPALGRDVRRRIIGYAIPSLCMSALGIAFCGFVVLPFVMRALLRYTAASGLVGTYQLAPTVGFVAILFAIFAIMFQLPIILSILASVGLVNAKMLADKWRHATVFIFIAAAIGAPDGNPLTMVLLAAPLLGLYLLSIVVVRFTQPKAATANVASSASAG